MTCSEAARAMADRRRQIEREPILTKAAEMRAAMKMPPHRGLPLFLTDGDRIAA